MNTKSNRHRFLMYIYRRLSCVEEMCGSRLKVAAVVFVLSTFLLLASVIAPLTENYTIPSSGSIGSPLAHPAVSYESEMRALFVHGLNLLYPDWELIVSTAQSYGFNNIVVEILYPSGSRYPSDYVQSFTQDELTPAIQATHARGMKLHASFNVLLGALGDEYKAVSSSGTLWDWTDPTNPLSLELLRNLTEELSAYDIDGLMFDYIRYDNNDMPYGDYSRQKIATYLNETITNWPGDFAPGMSRHNEFLEWRVTVIDDLVRDMRSWALGVNPDLEISAAIWGWPPTNPTYNRLWIGQDQNKWIKEGWLDFVSPMIYTTDINTIDSMMKEYQEYMVAGPEGKIPLVPFMTNCFPATVPADQFKQQIDTIRANGADGWIIWRYGGPGDGQGSTAPDIRQYLDLMELPEVFLSTNLNVTSTGTGTKNATITWFTTRPTTSKVEYSASPLFSASYKYLSMFDFHYWDIDHVEGIIVEDTTPVTSHMVTLTDLVEGTTYYYRVQSQDSSGIATSQVYTFKP